MTTHPARLAVVGVLALAVAAGSTACQSEDAGPATAATASSPGQGIASGEPHPTPKTADLSAYVSQQVSWSEGTCPSSMRALTLLSSRTACAKVKAPKDYTDPSKGDITLMVARTKAKTPNARILFTNPGGPGGPAARFSALVSQLSPLGRTHDVIGIDPRGTGESTPVSCEPARDTVGDDRQLDRVATAQAAVKKQVSDCVAKHGDYLPYITTDNTARDQDLVRQILGADKADYYGVSAGTWLGARYATLFPQHVGRFVLDSNTNFTGLFSDSFGTQPMSFQRRWDQQFLPWAARHDSTYHLGTTAEAVKGAYENVRKAASEDRLDVFSANAVDHLMAQQLYSDEGFRGAAQLLSQLNAAANGNSAGLDAAKRSVGGGGGAEYTDYREDTTFMAVTCNDTPWDKDQQSYVNTARADGPKYPLLGYGATSPCAYWPYTAPQTTVDLKGAPPMLMIQTELDPATAYEGAVASHQKVPANTRLLSVDNQGNHGALVGTTNGCVSTAGYDFLTQGKLIGQDSVCPAVPLTGEKAVYPVGSTIAGPVLPTADAYAKDKPGMAQQLLQELLQMLVDATRPPTR
ncbi:alpha/beta fold hydrolase [Luteipulveratus sp. YIM 133132]|uniref:Alpha/beta fold hydrolase n=1 Tax=Luteipulveratus flavus TaxID=3031728 RepID=A0ABT6CCH4_9MICO|nr:MULTISPECIES: alpha/beta fold hydrolase [unclassified Luteipulveratus]MDE9364590.1 alpha/beta fold hydrolase [Luteipulveratus sp. YIM 133132]MDF8265749.1 alpha/beta fold hydrolase [Luteipulveratus sp. YIM 133296]